MNKKYLKLNTKYSIPPCKVESPFRKEAIYAYLSQMMEISRAATEMAWG
jgi:hypothetical protein